MSRAPARRRLRCAVYTRKSSEEGLEQDFNSLDAQREACAAYIASQRHEGWVALPALYDDGGYSGGTMDRPALEALLADIKGQRVDVVVVYKVDRLTRVLADFAKIVEIFDAHGVSFVSVTQAFNTTTSMGRLTLNVLLSFAQFEREVTGERIRDKIAASKKKGLWMGGFVPLGYRGEGRTLVIHDAEASIVRQIFALYVSLGTVRTLQATLAGQSIHRPAATTGTGRTVGGRPFTRGELYKLLANPIYRGEIAHKGTRHPGQHPAIVDAEIWDGVQAQLTANTRERKIGRNSRSPSLLAGLLRDGDDRPLQATHATKKGVRYRYYVSRTGAPSPSRGGGAANRNLQAAQLRLAAADIEPLVIAELTRWLSDERCLGAAVETFSIEARERLTVRAQDLIERLRSPDPAGAREALLTVIQKVTLSATAMTFDINAIALVARCEGRSPDQPSRPNLVTHTIPAALRCRGVETKLILMDPSGAPLNPHVDPVLIKAIASGHRWFDDLATGKHRSLEDLAKANQTDVRYAARHLPLAFLAPRIVRAILDGTQPVELTAWDLLNTIELPLLWTEQERRLGHTV
jgi:site-specific DNA recombinase